MKVAYFFGPPCMFIYVRTS